MEPSVIRDLAPYLFSNRDYRVQIDIESAACRVLCSEEEMFFILLV